jgi:hypothetical protein
MQRIRSSKLASLAVRLCSGQQAACTALQNESLPAAASVLACYPQHTIPWSFIWQPWATGEAQHTPEPDTAGTLHDTVANQSEATGTGDIMIS